MDGFRQRSIVAIATSRTQSPPSGVGFLVGERHILTCAHTVNHALGRPLAERDRPAESAELLLLFPLLDGCPLRFARVDVWHPPAKSDTETSAVRDIAGLVITGEPPPREAQIAAVGTAPSNGSVLLFGYPEMPPRPDGGLVSGHLLGPVGGGRTQLDSDATAALRAQPGFSGSPVWDRQTGLVVGMFVAASAAQARRDGHIVSAETLCAGWPEVLADRSVPPCPYRGLESFGAADADYFVGRERDVATLRAKVEQCPLVVVVGPSGVGKSSLVHAGLCRMLQAEPGWAVGSCRPGERPVEAIAAELLRIDRGSAPRVKSVRTLARTLADGGLAAFATTLSLARRQRIVLIVDQLEELFHLDGSDAIAASLLDLFFSYANKASMPCPLVIVATLRADYYPRLLAHPNAGQHLADRLIQMSPLDADGLRRIIVEPAARSGVQVPEQLASTMVRDATSSAGALPLLEFALTELWPLQQDRSLDFGSYFDIGGVAGGVARRADAVLAELSRADPQLTADDVRHLLLALVSSLGGELPVIRRTCRKTELTERQVRALERMTAARLVISSTDRSGVPTYELAHESLLMSWPKMAELIRLAEAFLQWRSRIEKWMFDEHGLLPEGWLSEARAWCDDRPTEVNAAIHDLVARSEHEQGRRVRELQEARDEAREAARLADALRLAAQAELAGAESARLGAALGLGVESLRLRPTFEGDLAVRRLLALAAKPLELFVHDGPVYAVGFSSDGCWVVSGSGDGTARVFGVVDGAERCRVVHDAPVNVVTFGPDSRWVAAGSDDRTARVFDAASGAERIRLVQGGPVRAVSFSPDGRWVAVGGDDRTARVYGAATGVERCRLTHDGPVNVVRFGPDGRWVATGGDDRTARVFDAASGVERCRLVHYREVWAVGFSPDGRWMVSGSGDQTARVFHRVGAAERCRVHHDGPVNAVCTSPDGSLIATAGDDGSARVFDPISGAERSRLVHDHEVWDVDVSPDGRWVVAAGGDGTPRVFDAARGDERCRMVHDGPVHSVRFGPDGRTVATASSDGTARVFYTENGAELCRLVQDRPIRSVRFSPDGRWLAAGCDNYSVSVFNTADGAQRCRLLHDGPVNSVCFSPDGTSVVSGSDDGTARVFDVATGVERCRLVHDGAVLAVDFSPDGLWVVSGSDDRTARVFDAVTGAERCHMIHDDPVQAVRFSPGGQRIATGSHDRTARIFDPSSGAERCRLVHDGSVNAVAFGPDGRWLAAASDDGTVRVHLITTEDLVDAAAARMQRSLTDAEWERYGRRPRQV